MVVDLEATVALLAEDVAQLRSQQRANAADREAALRPLQSELTLLRDEHRLRQDELRGLAAELRAERLERAQLAAAIDAARADAGDFQAVLRNLQRTTAQLQESVLATGRAWQGGLARLQLVEGRFPRNTEQDEEEGHVHGLQYGSGAPTHRARRFTRYWDTAADALYYNTNGETTWVTIGGAAHAAVTLAGGSAAELTLVGQELSLAAVLTPTEHTAIGDGAPHHARYTDAEAISAVGAGDVAITGNWDVTGITGRIKVQTGGIPPVHSEAEGTLYWDTAGNKLYANSDGAGTWETVGPAAAAGAVLADGTVPLTAQWNPGAFNIGNYDYTARPAVLQVGDSDFKLALSGVVPYIQFDYVGAGDFSNITYNRTTDVLAIRIVALNPALTLDASGQLTLPGTGSSAGIVIGGDTQLYRSALNTLALAAGDTFAVDTITEITPTAGVTIASVLLKGGVMYPSADLAAAVGLAGGGGTFIVQGDTDGYWTYNRATNVWSCRAGGTDIMTMNSVQVAVDGNITVTGTVDGVDVAGHASRHADGGADEIAVQDLASDAATDGQVAVANGSGGVVAEEIYSTHQLVFSAESDTPSSGDTLDGFTNGICVGESGEHGAFTAIRAKATAKTAGVGTNTIVVEADDNPAFSSATTLFTLALNTSTEVDDTVLDNTWAAGDIFIRARWTAVGSTAPERARVEFYFKQRAENY